MVTAVCSSFCIACLRPLTRRYEASLFSLEIYDEKRTSLSITSASLWLLSES
ncbi:hypothetical protein QO220_20945 [Vibrio vulnificus]|nr:hypothetical protein [Vibrio vulnificus]MDK2604784.1 hypothetical protein [Vibrio vulnificus]MDK2725854.1 hypothetical protein [Vibrio vulnificus]